jgi:hypothetical protein
MNPSEAPLSDLLAALTTEVRDLRAEVRDLRRAVAAPSRRLLQRPDAAAYLGVSVNTFDRHVRPEVPEIRRGTVVLFDVEALDRWAVLNTLATCSKSLR